MKRKLIVVALTSIAMAFSTVAIVAPAKKNGVTFATYTNGDAATYYNSIDDSQSGNTLLTALRTLNLNKRQSTVGYSSMGTTPSGQFKYTDYDPDTVQYDSNGQPYGTKISSFYTYTSATSWNREHVWPNSHGGGSGGDAGSPYPDADIHMPRPTISSENSSRGNSFFVEGMNNSSSGWDPYTAGYNEQSRGEAARITFYCTLVNSKLILAPNNTTPSGTDSVTGQSYGSGHTMGNLETLIKWNINYPVTQREKNRNEGAEYLQGNRNAFVDHPEYACKIWGNVNSTIKNMCANASWDVGPSVSISKSTASIVVDDTTTISATSSDGSTISWSSSDTSVVTVSSASASSGTNITLTAIGPGSATITARATIDSTVYSATCTVTVTSSGGSGGQEQTDADSYSIVPTDLATSYPTTATSYTAASGIGITAYNTANFSSKVQFKKSGGYLYNNDSLNLGTLTLNGASGTLTVYAGTTKNPSSTTISGSNGVYDLTGYNYFKIINSSSSVATCTSIDVGIAATAKTLSSIAVSTAPTKTTYTAGEYFDPTGLVITRSYSDSTSDTYTYSGHTSEFSFSPSTSTALTTSNVSVTITYGGKSTTQAITVNAASKTLSSIAVSTAPTKTTYTAGEYFDPTGLVITRSYSDSTSDTYTYSGHTSEFSFSPSTSTALTTSNVSVTITYGGKSCSQAISVTSSGGGSQTETGSQRIVATSTTTYYETGSIYPTGSTSSATADCDAFSVSWLKNGGNNIAYTYAEIRVYASHSFTITPKTGYTITSVVITANSSSYANAVGGSSLTNCTKNVSSSTVTLTPTDGTSAVGFTNTAQSRINYIVVNYEYESGGSEATLSSITLNTDNVVTSFTVNATFSYSGLVVTAHYSDLTSEVVASGYTVSTPDMSTTGSKTVTVTYNTKTATYTISVTAQEITSITASVSKTYYVGQTIASSDLTVKDNNNNDVTGFTFANDGYQFVYGDAASGGALTNKTFTNSVSYSGKTCSLTVQVQRQARTDSASADYSVTYTDLPTAYQTSTTERTAASGVKFIAYNCANYSSKMQFKASGGYFQTTEAMNLSTLTINNRETNALTVYASNTAGSFSTTITGTNDVYDLSGYTYFKVMKSGSGAAYCASLTITVAGADSASNLANYIMYEDTNNQCTSKLSTAAGYLANLSSSERTLFSTSSDYVISTARTRLEAWAKSQGKTINYSTGELNNARNPIAIMNESKDYSSIIVISVATLIGLTSIGGYFFIRKRKEQ